MRVSKPLATTLLLIERSSSLDSSSSEGKVSDQHEFPVEVSAEPKSPRPSSFWNLTPARWLSMQDWIGRANRKPLADPRRHYADASEYCSEAFVFCAGLANR